MHYFFHFTTAKVTRHHSQYALIGLGRIMACVVNARITPVEERKSTIVPMMSSKPFELRRRCATF
jgi:hypothetical protein